MAKLKLQREACSPLGQVIFDFMVTQRLNLAQLAARCGLSPRGMRQSMLPDANPASVTLGKIAKGMGISIEELYRLWLYGKGGTDGLPTCETAELNEKMEQLQRVNHVLSLLPMDAKEAQILLEDQIQRGKAYLDLGQIQNARTELTRALKMAEACHDLYRQCKALRLLGCCAYLECTQRECLEDCHEHFDRVLELSERLKDTNLAHAREQKAAALANLGNVYLRQGYFPEAVDAYDRAIITAREDFPHYRWMALFGKGFIAQTQCDWEVAVEAYQMADLTMEESLTKSIILWGNLGYSLTNHRNYDKAEAVLLKAVRFAFREEEKHFKAWLLYSLGFNAERRALSTSNLESLVEAEDYYQQSAQTMRSFEATLGMARIAERSNLQQARVLALEGLEQLKEEPFNPLWDHTTNVKTVLELLGSGALKPVLEWIGRINEHFPKTVQYWEPVERKALLKAIECLIPPVVD
ncbi:tetratricopeptide repeat protein [Anthocerotibacter panamensis]|uniref:tetratricopeptide repeat protein n=1 Tax=Anthocerotibacter panamensis TaxID=2857077 RepID=UPI001C407721|nr:tetratricopeptide repeat protein [Anthocerotibacter panamensis]